MEHSEILVIRRSEIEDLQSVYSIERKCFPPELQYGRQVMRVLITKWGLFYSFTALCESNKKSRIVGFGSFEVDKNLPTLARIVTLEVLPSYQNRGVGKRIMEKLEVKMIDFKVDTVQLQVLISNSTAINFYISLGYKKIKQLNNYYKRGHHAFLMEKKIS